MVDRTHAAERCGPRGESLTLAQARGAAADLRHLEWFLSALGREYFDVSLDPHEEKLCRRAGRLATRVGAIAQALEEALARAVAEAPKED
ncbi:MAG: hypothetical protein ACRELA_20175 [Candidatus Rokuibacteriota bacterium]